MYPYPFARIAAVALVVALAVAVLPTQSQASCTGSDRLSGDDADCMAASFRNKSWPNNNAFDARNLCHQIGKIVVKVDIKGLNDKTWHISGSSTYRNTSPNANTVRGIYCCKDLSDLCNKADLLTDDTCEKEWEDSDADDTCRDETVTVSDFQCKVEAECNYVTAVGGRVYDRWIDNTVYEDLDDVDDLKNCDGHLEVGGCDD